MTDTLAAALDDAVRALRALVAEEVEARLADIDISQPPPSPYLSVVEAAAFLRCKNRRRVDDLLSRGVLTRHKDGSRTLIARDELQNYVRTEQR